MPKSQSQQEIERNQRILKMILTYELQPTGTDKVRKMILAELKRHPSLNEISEMTDFNRRNYEAENKNKMINKECFLALRVPEHMSVEDAFELGALLAHLEAKFSYKVMMEEKVIIPMVKPTFQSPEFSKVSNETLEVYLQ